MCYLLLKIFIKQKLCFICLCSFEVSSYCTLGIQTSHISLAFDCQIFLHATLILFYDYRLDTDHKLGLFELLTL